MLTHILLSVLLSGWGPSQTATLDVFVQRVSSRTMPVSLAPTPVEGAIVFLMPKSGVTAPDEYRVIFTWETPSGSRLRRVQTALPSAGKQFGALTLFDVGEVARPISIDVEEIVYRTEDAR